MKAISALLAIALLMNTESASAIRLHPAAITDVQVKS